MPNSELQSVLQPVASAKGLPNAHYTCDQTFAEERQKVLFDNWAGIGFAQDLAPGEAMPIDFVGLPLVAVRTREGTIKVFQNTCRHRGMVLVEEKKAVGGVIRCPYHSWCYALTGELVATPHVGGPGHNTHAEIRREELGLNEVRSHVWRDVIFVNVNAQAPEFEDYAADAIARWQEYEGQPVYGAQDSQFKFDVACNWKLAVENYCESYHLPWIHPGLNSYSRLEDHYNIEAPGAFSGQGTMVYRPMITESGQRFPDFIGLSDKWDAGAEYLSIYPNVLLGVHRDHAFAILLEPKAKDQTVEHIALYYASEEAATGPEWSDMRSANTEMWREVFKEDIFVVEGMQKGRRAHMFDGGKFSPAMDGPTHCFHHWVASQMIRPLAAE
ncbi:GbcA Glycine betaine demethylase subunit A [Candidatus Rhodobacter oscarellae]|uniref:GbcA Glycine betaine demethylase subunit A n=1 Tax=Candidatus Rhodobacter oscarellae TaxID=1675527 RepID=A0A0J9E1C5_9RHOB|nr:aromatic ring-hydroxylating dioxygenase subunit alpha [Candidatus Rhodobacter lobularis]KMW56487.1 GbcA Glycine betaine demethylase subunit A [Candidatus Rhodobacter lobularis]